MTLADLVTPDQLVAHEKDLRFHGKMALRMKYGELLSIQEARRIKDGYDLVVKSDYPRVIVDRADGRRRFVFLPYRNLGVVRLDAAMNYVEDRSDRREAIIDRILERNRLWMKGTEELVASIVGDRLGKLEAPTETFNIIKMIITHVCRSKVLRSEEIESCSRDEKMKGYLYFLERIGYIASCTEGYTYTEKLAGVQADRGDVEGVLEVVVGDILKHHYAFLQDFFQISRYDPFIKLCACTYSPSLDTGARVFLSVGDLADAYMEAYKKEFSSVKLRYYLHQLESVKIVSMRRELVAPTEDLCEEMFEKRVAFIEKMMKAVA